jgi:hypothetical protein
LRETVWCNAAGDPVPGGPPADVCEKAGCLRHRIGGDWCPIVEVEDDV